MLYSNYIGLLLPSSIFGFIPPSASLYDFHFVDWIDLSEARRLLT